MGKICLEMLLAEVKEHLKGWWNEVALCWDKLS